jgi:hypothetical protein
VQIAIVGQLLELRHGHQRTDRHTNMVRHATLNTGRCRTDSRSRKREESPVSTGQRAG